MVFDLSSGGFHLVDSALVLTLAQCNGLLDAPQGHQPPHILYQFLKCLYIAKMPVAHSFIHLPPLLASVGGSGRWGDAISLHPTALADTPMAGEFPQC